MTAKKLNHCQAQWSLYLSRFNFTMHHWPGHSMGKSDALSRRVDHGTEGGDNSNVTLLHPEFFATHVVRTLSGLSPEGEEHDILHNIWSENCVGKQKDGVVKVAEELWRSKGKSIWVLEWSERNGLLCFQDCIYVPNDPDLRHRITSQHHDTEVVGHARCWKTLELVSPNYWWPQMSHYINQYVKTCDLCLWTKVQWHRSIRELHPLSIPENHWDVISIDFIEELPDLHGHDAIMNVVDSVGK
jgi:hypothetical protein